MQRAQRVQEPAGDAWRSPGQDREQRDRCQGEGAGHGKRRGPGAGEQRADPEDEAEADRLDPLLGELSCDQRAGRIPAPPLQLDHAQRLAGPGGEQAADLATRERYPGQIEKARPLPVRNRLEQRLPAPCLRERVPDHGADGRQDDPPPGGPAERRAERAEIDPANRHDDEGGRDQPGGRAQRPPHPRSDDRRAHAATLAQERPACKCIRWVRRLDPSLRSTGSCAIPRACWQST